MSKPDFLNEDWYRDIQRKSAEEGKAIADAIELLQKTFEIKKVVAGYQGDDFEKMQTTLIVKLKSNYKPIRRNEI